MIRLCIILELNTIFKYQKEWTALNTVTFILVTKVYF